MVVLLNILDGDLVHVIPTSYEQAHLHRTAAIAIMDSSNLL